MRALFLHVAVAALLSVGFAGCFGGKGGDGNTSVGDLDETAFYDDVLADNGFRVSGALTNPATALATGANGSAVLAMGVDLFANDSAGETDLATFIMDAVEAAPAGDANGTDPNATASGLTVTAKLVSMTSAAASGLPSDLMGGVSFNQQIHGATGMGIAEYPEVKSYLTVTGLCRVQINGQTEPDLHLVNLWVTRGIRDKAGSLATAVDNGDLEVHVFFPGSTIASQPAFPGVADGWFYAYFENVRLEQMTTEEKALVGGDLLPPATENQLPLAVASFQVGGQPAVGAVFQPGKMIEVTMDGSGSSDPDGTIEAYSWTVYQLNATGGKESSNKTTGMISKINLTSPGPKFIELRVIDSRGGIANITVPFIVNYTIPLLGQFNVPGQVVGAQTSCMDDFNCLKHTVTVEPGANRIFVKLPTQRAGTCNTPHLNVYEPNGTRRGAADATADVTYNAPAGAALAVGKWTVKVWYTAHANGCGYSSQADVFYGLPAA